MQPIVIVQCPHWEGVYLYGEILWQKPKLSLGEVLKSLVGIRIGSIITIDVDEGWLDTEPNGLPKYLEDLPDNAILSYTHPPHLWPARR